MSLWCMMSDSRFFELRALLKDIRSREGSILNRMEQLMSKISDFAAAMNAHNDAIDAAVGAVQADVAWLKEQIEKLQNTPGEITPEDQALLDALQVRTQALAERVAALDAMTPPKPPEG